MIDIDRLLESVDLRALIEHDLGSGRRAGRWMLWTCPFHNDGTPSMGVGPENRVYKCFGCGAHGDGITWLREYHKLAFREACERLGAGDLPDGRSISAIAEPVKHPEPPPYAPPPADWQVDGLRAVEECEAELWKPRSRPVLDYLHRRGLEDAIIRKYRLGYCSTGQRDTFGRNVGALWIPRGVVIPCFAAGALWYLKIRLAPGIPFRCSNDECRAVLTEPGECPRCGAKNKYRGVSGNASAALFGYDNLRGAEIGLLVEGEFDCMIADQAIGDVCGVATLGSASNNLDLLTFGRYLLPLRARLLTYDLDASGNRGAARLADELGFICASLPALPGVKDITDYHLAGGDLWPWLKAHLAALDLLPRAGAPVDLVSLLLAAAEKAAQVGDWNRFARLWEAIEPNPTIPWNQL